MRSDKQVLAFLVIAIALTLASCKTTSVNEVTVTVPMPASEVALAATTYRPDGDGPFPLVVLSHGTPTSAHQRAGYGYWRKPEIIETFVSRGFAVIVPIRRGFGATGGTYVEGMGSCADPEFYRSGLVAAEDILAAVNYASQLPFVDRTRILLVGQSWGGIASIAAASHKPEGVIAVANFAGGRGGNPSTRPGEPCFPERMAEAIGRYAKTIDVPVFWHYAENDKYFAPKYARQWFNAFENNGGKGKLVMQPPFGNDGHNIFVSWDGVRFWGPALDQFFTEFNLQQP